VPLGIQMVLFPWLVAVVLHMDAFAVGVAQAAIMAPSLLFLALGGLVADRGNPRRLLLRYHLLYAAPPLALALVLSGGGLSYPLLIAYGIVAGSIGAFAVPTRDALLPVVAPKAGLPRAVALATALQFGGQLLGIACASTADRFGPLPLLVLHAALVLLGCFAVWRLDRRRIRRPSIRDFGAASARACRRRPSRTRYGRCCCSISASAPSMSGRLWPCCRWSCATITKAARRNSLM
jgi:MFS family permease